MASRLKSPAHERKYLFLKKQLEITRVFLLGSTYAVPLSGVAGMTSFRQAVE
jgi:hypothetical protein